AVLPLTRCPPLELGRLGSLGQRRPCAQERLDVDAVVDWRVRSGHFCLSFLNCPRGKSSRSCSTFLCIVGLQGAAKGDGGDDGVWHRRAQLAAWLPPQRVI